MRSSPNPPPPAARHGAVPNAVREDPVARRLASFLYAGPILLYDGVCGLCDRSVQFVLRHDPGGAMRFATLQGELGQAALAQLPQLTGVDSVVLLRKEGVSIRSSAVLEVLRYLGGPWKLALVAYALPRPLRDWAYDAVAGRRYRIFGKYDACPIPTPETRARFLDL